MTNPDTEQTGTSACGQVSVAIRALAVPQSAPAVTAPHNSGERLPNGDTAVAGADTVALAKNALGLFLRHLRGNSRVLLDGYEINITREDYEKIFDAHATLAAPQSQPSRRTRLCSCKASLRDGQHMAWCTSLEQPQAERVLRHHAAGASEPAAHMTVEIIEAAFNEYRNTLTVVDKPANFDSFSQGYVAGWNAPEAATPSPTAAGR